MTSSPPREDRAGNLETLTGLALKQSLATLRIGTASDRLRVDDGFE